MTCCRIGVLLVAWVVIAACGKKKEEALRMFEVKHSRYGCVIRETSPCAAGSYRCLVIQLD